MHARRRSNRDLLRLSNALYLTEAFEAGGHGGPA